ncbi:thiol-disulfide oxidoreductase DCC family protein [Burkholderia sp. Ac-20379]|uniref:thiol-disulfide oxidoreductase DCC family protein n=1 Tax=Burkholderia sp. Ac-20379 TaxID=2703900 RepID=UPI001980E251|nr:DUF393 domain-containing protein [Burkholderia sp. Ac-20379]MBN3726538.1 DUF393 domain-containing protein [Burkholderia sp. Ac-20379]
MNPAALELYFDGRCALCVKEVQRLERRDSRRRLAFVDIAAPGFDPAPLGVDLAALNREMHSRTAEGRVLVGIDSLVAAYTLTGRGWAVWPMRVPGLRPMLAGAYRLLARNRYRLSRRLGGQAAGECESGVCSIGNPFMKGEAAAASATAPAAPGALAPRNDARRWVVLWLYAAALAHVLVGAVLPWLAGSSLMDGYLSGIEHGFWGGAPVPTPARTQQIWWVALFGATLQCAGVWMLALVHLGNRLRQRAIWAWLLAGLLIWAPQDAWLSWQAGVMTHIAADLVALLTIAPPLVWLWWEDRA